MTEIPITTLLLDGRMDEREIPLFREAGLSERPAAHQVLLEDVETFKWNGRKGKIGF